MKTVEQLAKKAAYRLFQNGIAAQHRQKNPIRIITEVFAPEFARLEKLSTCRCGDGFTADSPGKCANCEAGAYGELTSLWLRVAELEKQLAEKAGAK